MSDSAEAPPLTFLVASPHLRGSFFGDALILLLEHTEEGAAGLVLTQSTGTPIHELLPDATDAQGEALLGGPVQLQVGWCLYERPVGGAGELRLVEGLMATTHAETFAQVRQSAQRYWLLLGYAGWSEGQLEGETREGAWLWLEDATPELLWDTPAEARWQRALDKLGVDPSRVAAGGAQA
ncbi:YqgE/AlgH family protein [Deinococcus radiophilus]|uniref:YqgE/AlgH family protein n=1 Tax=Deinococcus radiophilus TaxID=32062 RepID=A0A431VL19_9DEIO|nr:YqgE/AlgH family protein [Deinococcus radiophilus]RTR23429.1 YqgE/AlgH family protein [Deinococcus radiophilus]UFA50336.1 YqgE/AlgH family protein [Deinococcus radiophilus]